MKARPYTFLVTKRCSKHDVEYRNGPMGSKGFLTTQSEKACMAKHQNYIVIMGIPKWVRKAYNE